MCAAYGIARPLSSLVELAAAAQPTCFRFGSRYLSSMKFPSLKAKAFRR